MTLERARPAPHNDSIRQALRQALPHAVVRWKGFASHRSDDRCNDRHEGCKCDNHKDDSSNSSNSNLNHHNNNNNKNKECPLSARRTYAPGIMATGTEATNCDNKTSNSAKGSAIFAACMALLFFDLSVLFASTKSIGARDCKGHNTNTPVHTHGSYLSKLGW